MIIFTYYDERQMCIKRIWLYRRKVILKDTLALLIKIMYYATTFSYAIQGQELLI